MRRRYTPYSRLEEIRANRVELLALVLVTLTLGLTLSLLSDTLYDTLVPETANRTWVLTLALALTLLLTLITIWLFYNRSESPSVQVEMWLPYHLPGGDKTTIVRQRAYQVTVYAQRAWMRRYRENAPQTQEWLSRRQEAKKAGTSFQRFVRDDHVALSQCLLLYALHRAGEDILGAEADFGWWKVDLPVQRWTMETLPPPLGDNPFLRGDQRPDAWRLLLPKGVTLTLNVQPDNPWPRWTLKHPTWGQIDITWKPRIAVAGRNQQVSRVLIQHLRLDRRSELYILNARFEARARFRWTVLPRSDPFHRWATYLLARIEEALDWGYFLHTRPDRILADLDWKIGWWERDDSLVDALARLERRLDDLTMTQMERE